MYKHPWARLTIPISPRTIDSPVARRKYMIPNDIPVRRLTPSISIACIYHYRNGDILFFPNQVYYRLGSLHSLNGNCSTSLARPSRSCPLINLDCRINPMSVRQSLCYAYTTSGKRQSYPTSSQPFERRIAKLLRQPVEE